jgi:LysR family transcriptional activator of mexEF-oprN operon
VMKLKEIVSDTLSSFDWQSESFDDA